jgi:hypothetical protein
MPLTNTLNGMDANTLTQAIEEQLRQQMAQRTQESTQSAQQAEGQYAEAAAAPPPNLSVLQQFLPTLLGNFASTISQDPGYRERAQQGMQQERQSLMQARAQNLTSLRDVWSQRAEAAKNAGDFEAEADFRLKHEKISKTLEQMQDAKDKQAAIDLERERQKGRSGETAQEHKNRMAEIAAQGAQQRLTLGAKPKVSGPERAAAIRQGVNPETGLITQPFAQRELTRRYSLAKRGDKQSRNEAVNTAMEIHSQRWDSDKDEPTMGRRLLRANHPFYASTPKEARYLVTDEKMYKKVKGQWVKDTEAEKRAKVAINQIVAPWFNEE